MRHGFGLAGLLTLFLASAASGQGPLTPPGAPAPTMKTLDQVEARKPIPGGTTPFTISSSGSYYLTGNITVASGDVITINASHRGSERLHPCHHVSHSLGNCHRD